MNSPRRRNSPSDIRAIETTVFLSPISLSPNNR
jgi:hypothetical protein